jgi:predicted Holliday junction resolvase-like endonuclease
VVADLKALEAKRKQLLAESENIVKITTSVLEDKLEIDGLYEQAVENGRLAEEEYVKAKELAEEWKKTVKKNHEEAKQMRKEAIRPGKSTLTGQLATNL